MQSARLALNQVMFSIRYQILLLSLCSLFTSCGKDKNSGESPFSNNKTEPFPVSAYQQNPGSLQGNRYQMKATIDRQLKWRPGVGKLLIVQVSSADGLAKKVPVFFPEELSATVLPGQKLLLSVQVAEKSLITVEALEKF